MLLIIQRKSFEFLPLITQLILIWLKNSNQNYGEKPEPLPTSAPFAARYLYMFSVLYFRCLLARRRLRLSPWAALYLSTAYSSLSFHVFLSLFQVFISTTSFTTFAVSRSLPQHHLQLAIFTCFPFSISGVYQYDVVNDFRREPLSTSAPPTARYLSVFSALYSRCLLARRRLRLSPWAALYLSTTYSSLSFHVFRSLFHVFISTTSFTIFAVSRSLPQQCLQLAIFPCFPLSISGIYQHDVVYDYRREPLSTSAPTTARYLSLFSALYFRCLLVRRRLRRSPWAALYLSTTYSSLSFRVFRSLFQVFISTTSFTTFAVSRSLPQHGLQLAIFPCFPLSISGVY